MRVPAIILSIVVILFGFLTFFDGVLGMTNYVSVDNEGITEHHFMRPSKREIWKELESYDVANYGGGETSCRLLLFG